MSASAKQNDTPRTAMTVQDWMRSLIATTPAYSLTSPLKSDDWRDQSERAMRLALDELTAARAEAEALRNNYMELIMAVESKWPNETRHQTALRYIEQRERSSNNKPSAAIDAARTAGGEMMTTTMRHCETCGQQMLPTDYWQRKAQEIENAAYERAAKVCLDLPNEQHNDSDSCQLCKCAAAIRALIKEKK